WQNTIGGSAEDVLSSVQQTSDGGYILGGTSRSDISGDKTLGLIGPLSNQSDFWILKLNTSGSIVWQRSFGGTYDDVCGSVKQTADGGYIAIGNTSDFNGYHDYKVIKLNSIGGTVWENNMNGAVFGMLYDIEQTTDGGFIIGGREQAGSEYHFVVCKEDVTGAVIWRYNFFHTGGATLKNIEQTSDGGFMAGGIGANDYWVVKLNSTGIKQWENSIGGSGVERLYSAEETLDGGYILGGSSTSGISGDKTDPLIGIIDFWLVKLNAAGVVSWQKTIGGTLSEGLNDYGCFECYGYAGENIVHQSADGGYLLGCPSNSGISGDKTDANIGGWDFWVVKLTADDCPLIPYYGDYDNDGFGNGGMLGTVCYEPGDFYSLTNDDFNDCSALSFPGASEICDGVDNNFNGLTDEGVVGCLPTVDIEWENTIGGISTDFFTSVELTDDGGYIVGGFSNSVNSGDKTETLIGGIYGGDYWIAKLDISGNLEWDNTIGGSGEDYLNNAKQTADGGYILGGYSYSNISGDKTENSKNGSDDYWVIKLDASGNIEWQNTIGGNGSDDLIALQQTTDGGYILGGNSNSSISGDKTEAKIGVYDYWIIKLDAVGNIVWQNAIGGLKNDILSGIQQTADGGYIVGGSSESPISGDKTEGVVGGLSLYGDYWIIKLDGSGNIEWQNTIGGTSTEILFSIQQTADAGYFLGGSSFSSISGDKTQASFGGYDYWAVKVNSIGSIEWQKTIGGSSYENLYSAIQTNDGGFLLGGISNSMISGNKTEATTGNGYYDIYGTYIPPPVDYYIVKLDATGEITWQNSIGELGIDELRSVRQSNDGGFILGGFSSSGNTCGTKTEASLGAYDYWLVKLEAECNPTDEICNSLDDNCNGLIDDGVAETISISAGGPTTFCQGSNVVLTATHSGTSLQWKKNGNNIAGATNLNYTAVTTGNYTCTTTSACGTATSNTIIITANKLPTATITAGGATTFCTGGSVVLTANAGGGLSYQWYKGASLLAGATSINYTATTTGNYKCRVTKTATGCFKNSNSILVTVPCKEGSTADEQPIPIAIGSRFEIYPNPNNGTFTINSSLWP
ncbi:MAG: MopE-related protein, partial [Chitinophagales bacterium]